MLELGEDSKLCSHLPIRLRSSNRCDVRGDRLHSGAPLLHGGSGPQTVDAWQEARSQGQTVALMANSTETVTRLNQLAQHTRLTNGELNHRGPRLSIGDSSILVGDEVVTRRNARTLCTDQGLIVKNRDHWTVAAIHKDRSVTISGRTGTIRLPTEYVAEYLELGYAQTSHATQGRTVGTALVLVDTPADSRGVHTPMTRGRQASHAYVVTEDNQTAIDVLTEAVARDWIDGPAVDRREQLDPERIQRPTSSAHDKDRRRLEEHVQRLIDERRTIGREAERVEPPGLELG